MAPRALILDFDGTIALQDVGDVLCDRFAPPTWRDIDAAWERRELSLPAAQRLMWEMARATLDDIHRFLEEAGALRPGFGALLDRAEATGTRLVLASGGFDLYIRALLGADLDRFEATWFSTMTVVGDRVHLDFPHEGGPLACPECAVCKGRVCRRFLDQGCEVVFVGDGTSDRCAIGVADRLYAVRDSKLAAYCEEAAAAYVPFDSFAEIAAAL